MSEMYDAAAEIRGALLAINETLSEICTALVQTNDALQELLDHKASILVTHENGGSK